MGNAKLASEFIKSSFNELPAQLINDIMIVPNNLELGEDKDNYSESLCEEGLDLFLNLLTMKELYVMFEASGCSADYL